MKTAFIIVCVLIAMTDARRLMKNETCANAQFFQDFKHHSEIKLKVSYESEHTLSVYSSFSVTQSADHNSMNLDAYNIAHWASTTDKVKLTHFTGNKVQAPDSSTLNDFKIDANKISIGQTTHGSVDGFLDNLCEFLETGTETNELLWAISTHGGDWGDKR